MIKRIFTDKVLAYIMGIGLVLFVVHNPDAPFSDKIALPNIGLGMVAFSILGGLFQIKGGDFGPKAVYIPLLIIAACIAISGTINDTPLNLRLFGLLLIGVYFFARHFGTDIFKPMAWAVVISTVGMVAAHAASPGVKTGGWISPTNYDMATGLLIFATVVSITKSQWILTGIAIIGLFLTGADEAVFVVSALAVFVLVRRDFSKKILLPVSTLAMVLFIATPLGITQDLYMPTVDKFLTAGTALALEDGETVEAEVTIFRFTDEQKEELDVEDKVVTKEWTKEELLNQATGYRFLDHWKLSPVRPFGYGYNINDFYPGIPHNAILIIIEQLGIIGALAWLWLVGYGLFKTKWRYAWFSVFALGIFDHFIWTQAALWFPALLGVSTLPFNGKDLIFKNGD